MFANSKYYNEKTIIKYPESCKQPILNRFKQVFISVFNGIENSVLIQCFFSVFVNTKLKDQQNVIFNQIQIVFIRNSKQGTLRREGFKNNRGAKKGSNLIPKVNYH